LQKKIDGLHAAEAAREQAQGTAVDSRQTPTALDAKSGKSTDPHGDAEQLFATFPQARDFILSYSKANLERQFGDFFASAGLTPAQIAAFKSALTNTRMQSLIAVAPNGIRPTVGLPAESDLQSILGDVGFQKFQDFQRLAPANGTVLEMAERSGFSGVPISNEQGTQMTQIVANNSPDYQGGAPVNLNSVDWNTAMTQIQALLSPAQWTAIQGTFQSALFWSAVAKSNPTPPQPGR
jgi:hypothetical protein